jgi:ATP-grasp domain
MSQAFTDIVALASQAVGADGVDGVVIQPMISGGVETLVGIAHDPVFGPLVARDRASPWPRVPHCGRTHQGRSLRSASSSDRPSAELSTLSRTEWTGRACHKTVSTMARSALFRRRRSSCAPDWATPAGSSS